MKKSVIAVLLLILAIHTKAQEAAQPYYGFRLGLTAHPNLGFIKAEDGMGNGVSLGFAYGLIGDFNFAENYSISTGLTITTINGKSTEVNAAPYHTSGTTSIAYQLKYKMQYIEIPLTLKLKTGNIGGLKWFGQFGLSNDFRISAKQDAKLYGTVLADDVNSADWTRFYRAGMMIGGGAEFDLDGKTSVMAGLTLNNGITNISTGSKSVRNHYVAFNIGVFF